MRVLLLNDNDQLLLMRVEDFDIATLEGKKNKRFWCTIGGKIEAGESLEEAAVREIYEETGIEKDEVELGPLVWLSEFDMILQGNVRHFYEQFVVARTKQHNVSLDNLTPDEREAVKELRWFLLDDLRASTAIIFPVFLLNYLPDIIAGKYPAEPLKFFEKS